MSKKLEKRILKKLDEMDERLERIETQGRNINHEQTQTDTNEKKEINRNQITGMLYLNNIKPSEIAAKFRVTRVAVSYVISKERKSKRIADYIAKKIGKKREEIFGY